MQIEWVRSVGGHGQLAFMSQVSGAVCSGPEVSACDCMRLFQVKAGLTRSFLLKFAYLLTCDWMKDSMSCEPLSLSYWL